MIAQRITASVQQAYTPAVERAKLATLERRRADEMTQTARTLEREKKEAVEHLKTLQKHLAPVIELAKVSKQEFAQLVLHAQERVKSIKAEREKAEEQAKLEKERQRRIDDLVQVERKTAGAAHIFARHALEGIKKAGEDTSKVNWPGIEKAAISESLMQHRQDPKDVLAAIIKYSPGMVDEARQDKVQQLISTWVGKVIPAPYVSKQREGPSR